MKRIERRQQPRQEIRRVADHADRGNSGLPATEAIERLVRVLEGVERAVHVDQQELTGLGQTG